MFIISTPIGNLGDLTRRAEEVLRRVEVILAEDTRRTAILLRHYEIEGRLLSVHEHNEAARAERVVEMLREGKEVALVCDAGTPLVSDPGARVVGRVLEAGFEVVPVPGPSAVLAALVGSGLPVEPFTYYGFLPRKGRERKAMLEEIARSPHTSVLFESAPRLAALLRDLEAAVGADRPVAVARELTKLHEEFVRLPLGAARQALGERTLKGEIVVVLGGGERGPGGAEHPGAARLLARALLDRGVAPSAVAKELRARLGVSRNEAYEIAQELAEQSP